MLDEEIGAENCNLDSNCEKNKWGCFGGVLVKGQKRMEKL